MNFKDKFDLDNLSLNNMINEDTEFIPLMTNEDEDKLEQEELPGELSLLPLRNTVLFPGVVIPITAGRDKSIDLIQKANKTKQVIGVVSQKNSEEEDPGPKDIHSIGTVARILRMFKMPDGNTTVIIQGQRRFEVDQIISEDPHLRAKVKIVAERKAAKSNKKFGALMGSIKDLALQIIKASPNIPSEAAFALKNIESNNFLLNFISSNMNLDVAKKQALLVINDMNARANEVLKHLNLEYQMLEMKNEIQSKVKSDFDQQQREYFLHQQLKQIQEELGGNSSEGEIEEMRAKSKKKKWPKKVEESFHKELTKLQRVNPQVPEYSIQRNFLEFMLELPWQEYSADKFDLNRAEKILDRDHYGLEKVKERILEHLAVLKLKGDLKSPILCLYGPPGVGKTSLGKSVAEALGRKYVRMSLGGMRDEAEIRGHRKTYIGAMPGRIVQNIKKAGTSNPVFVLDEIDKLTANSVQGDPSSAMLEVLDPEQNEEFYDNYLEQGYDLSKVLFIATANNLGAIHPALRDRMEIIEINGYTVEEKVQIAAKHLLSKQLKLHGVKKNQLKLDKKTLEHVVDHYTRESGVRGLDKVVAKLVRYAAKNIARERDYKLNPKAADMDEVLGTPRYTKESHQGNEIAGVVTGLAWTPVGGDILFIESSLSRGKGRLTVTGNLGDVMKESATLAMAFLKAKAHNFGLDYRVFEQYDVNIHFPEGATPKDGPSAGIAILTSLASLFTQRKVKNKLAMTGEITLRGKVLPVGGIKEKILAAKRAEIKDIILCELNKKDVDEIREDYLKGLNFHYVKDMMEVIEIGLLKQKVKNAVKIAYQPSPLKA
jgi:ATP-dependent Lon protease